MIRRKYAAGLGAIAYLLCSTTAFAADATRSSSAIPLPTAQTAPTDGVRTSTPLKKKSNAISRNGVIALGIVGGAAVGTALYLVIDDDNDEADSPG